jgi:putative endonuclease
MSYFVYILECSNKALYTGITNDLERRFNEHRSGRGGHYTSANPGKRIRYYEEYPTRSKALKREAQIKRWSRTKKIALIRGESWMLLQDVNANSMAHTLSPTIIAPVNGVRYNQRNGRLP